MTTAEALRSKLENVKPAGHDKWTACCPAHESSSKSSLSIEALADGRVLLYDHGGCDVAKILGALGLDLTALYPPSASTPQFAQRRALPSAPVAPSKRDQHVTLAADWLKFWDTLTPPTGAARKYLDARDCTIPPIDGDLRCTESLRHPSGYDGPALVALVTDAGTRQPLTLHRTWVNPDGTKAAIDKPRLLLRKHRVAGGVIRLWPDEAVTTGLAIAEGIETALTLAAAFTPAWSLIDAGNFGKFAVLDGIESLLIAADNDPAGQRAAEQCALRWQAAGREVRIVQSPVPGEDLNDYARRAA